MQGFLGLLVVMACREPDCMKEGGEGSTGVEGRDGELYGGEGGGEGGGGGGYNLTWWERGGREAAYIMLLGGGTATGAIIL